MIIRSRSDIYTLLHLSQHNYSGFFFFHLYLYVFHLVQTNLIFSNKSFCCFCIIMELLPSNDTAQFRNDLFSLNSNLNHKYLRFFCYFFLFCFHKIKTIRFLTSFQPVFIIVFCCCCCCFVSVC